MQIAPFNTAECGGTLVDHETAGYASTSARKKVRRGKGNKFYLILLLWKVEGWQRTTRRHALSWTSSSAPRCLHHAQPVADQTWREREGKGGEKKKKLRTREPSSTLFYYIQLRSRSALPLLTVAETNPNPNPRSSSENLQPL